MKIIAINAENTKSAHEVAFEVDTPPKSEVLAKVSYGTLQISFRDPYLYVTSREHEPPISNVVVKNINDKYAYAEQCVNEENRHAESARQGMLKLVEQSIGLPVR